MGGVHQDFPYGVCYAVWIGGDVFGSGRDSKRGCDFWSGGLLGGREDGGNGIQSVGGLDVGSEKSEDGREVDSRFSVGGVSDFGGRRIGVGGRSMAVEPAVSDVEPSCGCGCVFLLVDKAIHVGIARVSRRGAGHGSCGRMVGCKRFV